MIKYSLRCDQNHGFEGWFRNSDDYEAQVNDGRLACPVCGSHAVSKSLMSPKVTGTRSQDAPSRPPMVVDGPVASAISEEGASAPSGAPNGEDLRNMLRAFRDHVVTNSDYVGDKFAEEARKMHFKESEPRGIYGEATQDEVRDLVEDGIDCLPLPVLPEDQN